MSDVREDILKRLVVVARAIQGVTGAYRNVPELDESRQPAVVIWDGDEVADDGDPKRQPGAPRKVRMTPEVWVMLGAEPENVGAQMNLYRSRLVKAVLADEQLKSLTGFDSRNGDIRYEGCSTGLSRGRTLEGNMKVLFSFGYVLRASDL